MELLAVLYTFLLVTICLLLALMLYRTAKPTANRDDAALKEWLRQQLDAQKQQMEAQRKILLPEIQKIQTIHSRIPVKIQKKLLRLLCKRRSFYTFYR